MTTTTPTGKKRSILATTARRINAILNTLGRIDTPLFPHHGAPLPLVIPPPCPFPAQCNFLPLYATAQEHQTPPRQEQSTPCGHSTPATPRLSPYPSLCDKIIDLLDWIGFSADGGTGQSDSQRLNSVTKRLQRLLASQGIDIIDDAGTFDPHRHQIAKSEPVTDTTLDRTIKRTEQPGYLFDGRVLRPQEVIVYKFNTNAV